MSFFNNYPILSTFQYAVLDHLLSLENYQTRLFKALTDIKKSSVRQQDLPTAVSRKYFSRIEPYLQTLEKILELDDKTANYLIQSIVALSYELSEIYNTEKSEF